jgi:23S rRNA pseudoU1915 N3-methylase RlmH
LEQAKPYASTAARLGRVLGRGAGASKGFEGAKIVEESARLRAAEQARQDRKEALDAELGVRREQISATKAAAEAAAGARLSQAQADIVAEFINNNNTYLMAAQAEAKKRGTTIGDPAVAAALRPLVQEHLRNVYSSVGGMGGLETQQGLSAEQKASLQAFLAS